MTEPEMVSNFDQNVLRPIRDSAEGGDIFYYLFVGRELSARGQDPVTAEEASALATAMHSATEFQFQYEENNFRCGQMTTGRFYKVAQCARMVLRYEAAHKLSYAVFILTRPDAFYRNPMPPNLVGTLGARKLAFVIVSVGDTVAMSGAALGIAAAVDNATCCDIEHRLPKGCFKPGLVEPETNAIFMKHFFSNGCRQVKTPWRATIKRSNNFHVPGFNVVKFHGKFRPEVIRSAAPRTSGVLAWNASERVRLIAAMLPGA